MGLNLINRQKNYVLGIWEINENLEVALLTYNSSIPNKFTSPKRKLEYICTRLLLKEIDENLSISYNEFGAPILNDNRNISISHSNNLVAIIVSEKKVAIDVEKINDRAYKIKEKFLSNNDIFFENEINTTLAWSAKETVFKLYQKGNIDFKEDIIIKKIDTEKKQIMVMFKKKNLVLNYQELNNHFLVYVCI